MFTELTGSLQILYIQILKKLLFEPCSFTPLKCITYFYCQGFLINVSTAILSCFTCYILKLYIYSCHDLTYVSTARTVSVEEQVLLHCLVKCFAYSRYSISIYRVSEYYSIYALIILLN